MSDSLVDLLETFNRKERHLLWEQATGSGERVELSDAYRAKLASATGLPVPANALVMVDFHLNWLYAALLMYTGALSSGDVHPVPHPTKDLGRQPYEHNQEDIDLLVAFAIGSTTHVLLVEAKGFTPWGTKQIRSKLTRLDTILGDAAPGPDVDLQLVLTSFEKWQKLNLDWPAWKITEHGEPAHVRLDKPADRRVVEECSSTGQRKRGGGYVHLQG